MVGQLFLQNWIFTKFAFPFLLIFFIVFAVLEKTKIFGDSQKQLNALLAFVIGLIFVSVAYPREVVGNLILFLTVGLVALFVILLLWGFVSSDKTNGFHIENWMKYTLWAVSGVAFILALIWSTGIKSGLIDLLFYQSWSSTLWTNIVFIVAIAGALALILHNNSK